MEAKELIERVLKGEDPKEVLELEEVKLQTQAAQHLWDNLVGWVQQTQDLWKTMYGDLVYYTQGRGSDQTTDEQKMMLGQIAKELNSFFKREVSFGGSGTLSKIANRLHKL